MQYSWDSYPYIGATFDSLNPGKITDFITKVNSAGRFHLPEKQVDALIKLNFLKNDIPTNAAMILFSKKNLLYNVHIGRFKTPSMIIADKMINGNLYDVVEESMQTIIGHLKFAFEITGRTTQRTEIPEYPLEALRELLLNSLIHRDYKSSTDVQIKIFDQKITFFNPGGLYGNLTEEDLKTDSYQASTRNKQLAEAFYLTHDIEKYGSGFIRIRQAIANYPTMIFNFHTLGQGFLAEFSYSEQKLTIKNDPALDEVPDKVPDSLSENLTKILLEIQNNKNVSMNDLANTIGISKRKILDNINKLRKMGLINRVGNNKSRYWQVFPIH